MTPDDAALLDGIIKELEGVQQYVGERLKQLREAKALQGKQPAAQQQGYHQPGDKTQQPIYHQSGDNNLEAVLSKLDWRLAKSGKCEYVGSTTATILAEFRAAADSKGELDGEKFHYIAKSDGAILRFRRRAK